MNEEKEVKSWRLNKVGEVVDDNGIIIAFLPDDSDSTDVSAIVLAPVMINEIKNFVRQVNSGVLKPRAAVNRFEKIIDRYENS